MVQANLTLPKSPNALQKKELVLTGGKLKFSLLFWDHFSNKRSVISKVWTRELFKTLRNASKDIFSKTKIPLQQKLLKKIRSRKSHIRAFDF